MTQEEVWLTQHSTHKELDLVLPDSPASRLHIAHHDCVFGAKKSRCSSLYLSLHGSVHLFFLPCQPNKLPPVLHNLLWHHLFGKTSRVPLPGQQRFLSCSGLPLYPAHTFLHKLKPQLTHRAYYESGSDPGTVTFTNSFNPPSRSPRCMLLYLLY